MVARAIDREKTRVPKSAIHVNNIAASIAEDERRDQAKNNPAPCSDISAEAVVGSLWAEKFVKEEDPLNKVLKLGYTIRLKPEFTYEQVLKAIEDSDYCIPQSDARPILRIRRLWPEGSGCKIDVDHDEPISYAGRHSMQWSSLQYLRMARAMLRASRNKLIEVLRKSGMIDEGKAA